MDLFSDIIKFKIKKDMGICNITDEFFCVLLNKINRENGNVLVVVNSLYDANKLYSSLINYDCPVLLFPMDDFLTSEALAISPDLTISRLESINEILSGKKCIVITNLMGYLRFLPSVDKYKKSIIKLNVGDVISPSELGGKLISIGYKRDTLVNMTGDFGLRGFVVDVFPIGYDNPIRLEFFDDEIESIRFFDAETQMSTENMDSVVINPFSEFIVSSDVDNLEYGKNKFLEKYGVVNSISDYISNAITIYRDIDQIKLGYDKILNDIEEYRSEKDSSFTGRYMFDFTDIEPSFKMYYYSVNNIIMGDFISEVSDISCRSINTFNENVDAIRRFIDEYIDRGYSVIICVKDYMINNIRKFLRYDFVDTDFSNIYKNRVNLIVGSINEGFIYNDLVVLSSHELFNVHSDNRKYSTKFKYSTAIGDVNKLEIGDYVVHNVHGIGVYNGIVSLTSANITKDYLEILYALGDKIYIPVEKINLISKYSGREGVVPKINSLNGTEWAKTKRRVMSKVNDMADRLLKLYAERETRRGYAFSPDNELMVSFAKDFPFELTPDQVRSIDQIREDMEKPVPMDRLLCGDVGFGKTEVAFRAAFKAIVDSKQVLFLCPTTILSNQHYNNAIVRFKNFPVKIGLLNRFTKSSEVRSIINGLKDGSIDMVIGTHRLLSNDVRPKDLGLLIIDEEQRFGVRHKEKLKEYKSNVDVLTLTATPIPRTLQMSLIGIRGLSLIETPPVNRYPVQTYVIEENEQILRDAINKELARDGQVFILYNRVDSIDGFSMRIKSLIPNARVGIAHGRMSKRGLENTIMDFVEYKFDILICTTIIETGMDIPNVNTLIIIDADRFGLSQLYQLRGRVGRSNRFAYAYLMYKPNKILSDVALKRLNVIKEFTELGSGFSIASRDLSIRGAGDILGSEQAGFIDSVGVDLYLKMLNDEVKRRENVKLDDDTRESKNVINVTTHIPDNYVSDDDLKIEIHKLISTIDSEESFNRVKTELEDRFGRLSDEMIIYMYSEWFSRICDDLHVEYVRQMKSLIEVCFPRSVVSKMDTEEVFVDAFNVTPSFRFMSRGDKLVIVLDTVKLDKHPIYYLIDLMRKIYDKFGDNID